MLLCALRVIYIHDEGDNPPKEKAHESEDIKMRTIITLDGKKINKNAACEMFGKEDMDKRIKEAKEVFFEEPNEECSWWMGIGMLTIKFR